MTGTLKGFGSRAVAYNATTNKIYLPNSGDIGLPGKTLSEIDGATNSVSTTLTVGRRPLGVGVNATTGRVLAGNFGAGSIIRPALCPPWPSTMWL